MAPTVILITGANRGLGKGLLQRYLAQPNNIVIAGNRDPAHPTSQSLADLPKGEGSRLIVVKIDASAEQDASNAVKELQDSYKIDHLDIVIANAGVSYIWPSVADVKIADLHAHIEPNVYGVIRLYQATRPLLRKSTKTPMFLPMGSTAGCIANQPPIPNAAYGTSKAAVNWLAVRIAAEEDWLSTWVLVPGWVKTDLGLTGAKGLGLDEAAIEKSLIGLDDSCDGMVKVIATSTKEKHGGKLVAYNGHILDW